MCNFAYFESLFKIGIILLCQYPSINTVVVSSANKIEINISDVREVF